MQWRFQRAASAVSGSYHPPRKAIVSISGPLKPIDTAFEGIIQRQRLGIGERQELHVDDTGYPALAVDPVIGVVDPAPAQAARRALAGDRIGRDQEAKPPLVTPIGYEGKIGAAFGHRAL